MNISKCLPPCDLGSQTDGVRVGSVVLLQDDNRPRLIWPLGVVTSVFPGRDGLVRTVEVKTAKGVYMRPVQRIHDLEMANHGDSGGCVPAVAQPPQAPEIASVQKSISDHPTEGTPVTTRSGRKVKAPKRLDPSQ